MKITLAKSAWLMISFLAGSLLLLQCSSDKDPGPEPAVHMILGKWRVETYKKTYIVPGGESLVDFIKSQGYTDEEATFYAYALLHPFEDDPLLTMEFREDGTFTSQRWYGSSDGTWELSEDEKIMKLNMGAPSEVEATVAKLTPTNLELIVESGTAPFGLTLHLEIGAWK